jgi:translocation and assembly module TamA
MAPEVAQEIGITDPYRVSAFDESATLEWRDNPLDPRRGVYAQIMASEGGEAIGGTSTFTRATAEGRGYLPIGERLVLAARLLYGRALTDGLPITERFFEGGAASHRGFAFRQLSPDVMAMDGNEVEVGGEEELLGSGEVRLDVARIKKYPFGVAIFTDAGDVTPTVGEIDPANLHWAAGVGFRYSPIVAIRVDLGYRLNRYGPGEPDAGDRFAFHLSLGEAF